MGIHSQGPDFIATNAIFWGLDILYFIVNAVLWKPFPITFAIFLLVFRQYGEKGGYFVLFSPKFGPGLGLRAFRAGKNSLRASGFRARAQPGHTSTRTVAEHPNLIPLIFSATDGATTPRRRT